MFSHARTARSKGRNLVKKERKTNRKCLGKNHFTRAGADPVFISLHCLSIAYNLHVQYRNSSPEPGWGYQLWMLFARSPGLPFSCLSVGTRSVGWTLSHRADAMCNHSGRNTLDVRHHKTEFDLLSCKKTFF